MIESELTISRLPIVGMIILRHLRNVLGFAPENAAKNASVGYCFRKNKHHNKWIGSVALGSIGRQETQILEQTDGVLPYKEWNARLFIREELYWIPAWRSPSFSNLLGSISVLHGSMFALSIKL